MTALKNRLYRGLEAMDDGDLETAEDLLDEVAAVPGSLTPIPGLTPDAEAAFYDLLSAIADEREEPELAEAAWERARSLDAGPPAADLAPSSIALTVTSPPTHLSTSVVFQRGDDLVEVHRHSARDQTTTHTYNVERERLTTDRTLTTVETFEATVILEPGAELPEAVEAALGLAVQDRAWREVHIEEVVTRRARVVYEDQ